MDIDLAAKLPPVSEVIHSAQTINFFDKRLRIEKYKQYNPNILCNVSCIIFTCHILVIFLFFKIFKWFGILLLARGHQPLSSFHQVIKLSCRWLPWSIPAARSRSHPIATSIDHGRRRHTTPPNSTESGRIQGSWTPRTGNFEVKSEPEMNQTDDMTKFDGSPQATSFEGTCFKFLHLLR